MDSVANTLSTALRTMRPATMWATRGGSTTAAGRRC